MMRKSKRKQGEVSDTGGPISQNMFDASAQGANDDGPRRERRERRERRGDVAMSSKQHSIAELDLEGLTPTQAKDIEQVLHLELLAKYYFHREVSQAKGSKGVKKKRLIALLKELGTKEAPTILTTLKDYLKEHGGTSGQRNILASVILVTYKDGDGEKHTQPFKLSESAKTYNFLDHQAPGFKRLMNSAHHTSICSAMHDYHTETALMVALQGNLPAIRAKYGDKQIERISICVDSRLSGCNDCVEKVQSVREELLKDTQGIRVSISFHFETNYSGQMGRSDKGSSRVGSSSSTQVPTSSSSGMTQPPPASPMLTSSYKPLNQDRVTDPHRSPDKQIFIRSIMESSTLFLSGSSESTGFSATITDVLEECNVEIELIIKKLTNQLFPKKVLRPTALRLYPRNLDAEGGIGQSCGVM